MIKNVLVTGGAGYIGGAITDLLLASGKYNFRVYDNLLYEDSYRKNVDFVFGDIQDKESFKKQLEWADCVIHLAAIVGDGACTLDPDLTVKVNQDTVQWLSENFNGRIIFASTCSVYGAQENELDETSPVKPLSLYAGTKLKCEDYLANKNAICFRLGTLFGVSDLFSRVRMDLVVNYMTGRAHTAGEISVFGGDQFRPLFHVKDAAGIMVENIETPHTGIYNAMTQNTRIIDQAYQVRSHYPDLEVKTTQAPFQDTRNYRVSNKKAREILGFVSKYTIDDGIKEVKEAIATKRIKDLTDLRYSNHLFLKDTFAKKKGGNQEAVKTTEVKVEEVKKETTPVTEKVPAQEAVTETPSVIKVQVATNINGEPELITGGLAVDDRGQVSFVNGFGFADVKRFYLVENFSDQTIRAWHGHQKEAKYVLVIGGSAIVAVTKMDSTTAPSKNSPIRRYVLSARKPEILRIPAGYANGFRPLEPNTKIMFLSTASLEESKGDDYRFPADYWGGSIWEVENR